MAEFDNMLRSLPVAYRTDKWVCDLLAAIQSLDDTQREQMLDITQQLFPGSMTWALAIEERDAGLASTGTLEERRTALIARWRACDSWKNGEISVGFAEGVIVLTFVGAYGVPEAAALAALQDAIEHTIPCHLETEYLYRYLLVREVDGMTLDELQGHTMHDFAF